MTNKFLKYNFLILLLWIFANNSNAQTPVCNLQVDVFEFNPVQVKLTEYAVGDVNAVLTDLTTGKNIEFSKLTKTPFFNNLTAGSYKIEITKNGYQRRVKEFQLVCKNVEMVETISKSIYLQKGNSAETSNFKAVRIGAAKDTDNPESENPMVNGKASRLVTPVYPPAARAVRAVGTVNVEVTIDEDGEVIEAKAVSGHPLLRSAAEKAARDSKFSPTFLEENPVQIIGIINYNFKP